jgi:hypothetical protein
MLPEIASDSSFYQFVQKKIIEQLGLEAENPKAGSAAALLNTLREARIKVKPNKLVLLFDELENLEYKFSAGSLTHDIVLFLAGLLEGKEPLSFVVSGSDQQHLDSKHWRLLSPKITARRIGMLSNREATLLVVKPLQQLQIVIGESICRSILRLSGCHPYYTQLVCRLVVDELNESKEYIVTPEHVNKALSVLLESPPAPLTYVWKSFDAPIVRAACSGYAFTLKDENDFAIPDKVVASLPPQALPMVHDKVKFRSALERLVSEEWLETNSRGAYRFRMDLCRLWTKRYHSVWQMTEELVQKRDIA